MPNCADDPTACDPVTGERFKRSVEVSDITDVRSYEIYKRLILIFLNIYYNFSSDERIVTQYFEIN